MIQAWAQEQEEGGKRAFEEQDVLVPWRLQKNMERGEAPITARADNSSDHLSNAEAVEEDRGMKVYHRYCHVYCRGELEALCER